jgi:hypothetical protein
MYILFPASPPFRTGAAAIFGVELHLGEGEESAPLLSGEHEFCKTIKAPRALDIVHG